MVEHLRIAVAQVVQNQHLITSLLQGYNGMATYETSASRHKHVYHHDALHWGSVPVIRFAPEKAGRGVSLMGSRLCIFHRLRNSPSVLRSTSGASSWTTRPLSSTTIRSKCSSVESRCDTAITVRCSIRRTRADWTSCSV